MTYLYDHYHTNVFSIFMSTGNTIANMVLRVLPYSCLKLEKIFFKKDEFIAKLY